MASFQAARNITRPEDCYFYHTVELPGLGVIQGDWDLRTTADDYLGHVELQDKRVLELGPANGFLTCHMERAGADVIAYDLDEQAEWDVVPFAGSDYTGWLTQRRDVLRTLNNGWWLTHNLCALHARLMCGSVYELPHALEPIDVAIVGALLLHVRDPFLALQRACAVTRETVVVTELVPFRDNPGWAGEESTLPESILADTSGPEMIFQPKRTGSEISDFDTWWHLTPALVRRFLAVLGFENAATTFHVQRHRQRYRYIFHTTVAHRTQPTSGQ
jgi:hypothetical protein